MIDRSQTGLDGMIACFREGQKGGRGVLDLPCNRVLRGTDMPIGSKREMLNNSPHFDTLRSV